MKVSRYGLIPLGALVAVISIPLFSQSQAPATSQTSTPKPTVGLNAKISGTDAAVRSAGVDPDVAKHGGEVYLANCGTCHGSTGKGTDVAPDLVRSALVEDDNKGDLIGPVIKYGRPDKGMPALSLTPEEITDVAGWLRVQVYGAAMRGTYNYLDIVVGDPKKGETFFNGAGKCNTCHSVTGDLAGIGGKYDPPTLQSRWVSGGGGGRGGAAGRGRGGRGAAAPALEGADQNTYLDTSPPEITKSTTTITVTLASGQKIDGVPLAISDFNVTFKDMNGGYHSIEREGDFPKVETHNPLAPHGALLKSITDDDMHNVTAYLVTLK